MIKFVLISTLDKKSTSAKDEVDDADDDDDVAICKSKKNPKKITQDYVDDKIEEQQPGEGESVESLKKKKEGLQAL